VVARNSKKLTKQVLVQYSQQLRNAGPSATDTCREGPGDDFGSLSSLSVSLEAENLPADGGKESPSMLMVRNPAAAWPVETELISPAERERAGRAAQALQRPGHFGGNEADSLSQAAGDNLRRASADPNVGAEAWLEKRRAEDRAKQEEREVEEAIREIHAKKERDVAAQEASVRAAKLALRMKLAETEAAVAFQQRQAKLAAEQAELAAMEERLARLEAVALQIPAPAAPSTYGRPPLPATPDKIEHSPCNPKPAFRPPAADHAGGKAAGEIGHGKVKRSPEKSPGRKAAAKGKHVTPRNKPCRRRRTTLRTSSARCTPAAKFLSLLQSRCRNLLLPTLRPKNNRQ